MSCSMVAEALAAFIEPARRPNDDENEPDDKEELLVVGVAKRDGN